MSAINPDLDLAWLFWDSAAELGYSSAMGHQLDVAMSGGGGAVGIPATDPLAAWLEPGWISAATLTPRQVNAASRQRWLLASFRKLQKRHQSALCISYELRHPNTEDDGPALASNYGIAANIVRRILRDNGKTLRWAEREGAGEVARAVRILTEAHLSWQDIRRDDRAAARAERDRARAQGRRRSELLLSELLGDPVDADLRAEAWMEALGLSDDAVTPLSSLREHAERATGGDE